jgi:MarR family transcriptional regulator, organic hydroperoxide resistance regulator
MVFRHSKPEESLGLALWQATSAWQNQIKEVLMPYGVTHTQFVILAILFYRNESKQSEIQKLSKLEKMTLSKALKELQNKKLLEKLIGEDKRSKTVILTQEGEGLVKILIQLVESEDEKFFSLLGKKEQQGLIASLRKVAR